MPDPMPTSEVEDRVSRPARESAGVSIDEAIARWKDRLSGRCTPRSAERMISALKRVSEWAGWRTVADIDFSSADAVLSARRRGDRGIKWAGTTHDQNVSVLKTFGEFLRKSGMVKANPLLDLEPCGEKGGDGARPLTPDQARLIIAHSINRHLVSRRATGCAPLAWLTLFYTGLRYTEGQSMTWGCFAEDEHGATIVTDPKWEGNKSGDKDEIPVRKDLYRLLLQHKTTVPHGPNDLVFPKYPTRHTWQLEREAAGIARNDPRLGKCSPHSCRKSFCTWLDAQSIPRGLVSHLARHAASLAESRYIRHDQAIARKAVEGLPPLWPDGLEIFSIRCAKKLAPGADVPDDGSVTPDSSPMCYTLVQLDQTDGPVTALGSGVTTDRNGPGLSVQSSSTSLPRSSSSSARPFSSSTECGNGQVRIKSGALNRSDRTERDVVRVLSAWLARRVDAAPQEPCDDQPPHS